MPDMPIVAKANTGYSIRILIMAVLCAVFAFWFAKDGWIGYPQQNDAIVQRLLDPKTATPQSALPEAQAKLKSWPGYANASSKQISEMGTLVKNSNIEDWHTELDMLVQRGIVFGLVLGVLATLYFYYRYTRKRAIADEAGLSPAQGILIPWESITKIDNTQWDKRGIVTITYKAVEGGEPQTAILDDYDLDNLPAVLEEVSNRAIHAEFDPPLADPDGAQKANDKL